MLPIDRQPTSQELALRVAELERQLADHDRTHSATIERLVNESKQEITRLTMELNDSRRDNAESAVVRKCRDVLAECDRPGADDTNYHAVVVHRREALAEIEQFLRDNPK